MNTAKESICVAADLATESGQVVNIDRRDSDSTSDGNAAHCRPNRLFNFLAELRRRRVCRAATLYAVGFWLICQVVDVLAPAMDLPDWTLKLIVVLGIVVFPIALVLSWLIDITPEGLVADVGDSRSRPPAVRSAGESKSQQALDCALLAAAALIGVYLATGLLVADVEANPGTQRIAVEDFRLSTQPTSDAISVGLLIELQHALRQVPGLIVVDAKDNFLTPETLLLSGAITYGTERLRVTSTIVDNGNGEVVWSDVIEHPKIRDLVEPATLAQHIVSALPMPIAASTNDGSGHAH